MKHSEALSMIAEYYKEPLANNIRVKLLKEWMIANIVESDLAGFVNMVLSRLEWFPKIAELERMRQQNPELAAERAWATLLPIGSSHDVLIHDRVAYQVVAGYGSWLNFCRSRDDYMELTHKDFVRRYVLFGSGDLPEPAPLAGEYHVAYGSAFQTSIEYVEVGRPSSLPAIGYTAANVAHLTDGIFRRIEHEH